MIWMFFSHVLAFLCGSALTLVLFVLVAVATADNENW